MMKKFLTILMILLMTALLFSAFAEQTGDDPEAPEITERCTIALGSSNRTKNLTDKKYTTYMESKAVKNPELTVTIKDGTRIGGLYLCFEKMPDGYEVQENTGNGWETVASGDTGLYHAFYELHGAGQVRVVATGDKKQIMGFNEVSVFGEGTVPEWVQRWEPVPEKTDLLFVVSQPEEEILFLGGAIPTYSTEKGNSVAVACFSFGNTTRRSELLNGLWNMGYRYYPIIGEFKAGSGKNAAAAYRQVDNRNGEEIVQGWLTEIIRKYKPEVIVGPDLNGEGGNGRRMMMADACIKCWDYAADESRFPETAEEYGAWQPSKLYLHLYGDREDQTVFDWEQPLEKMDGWNGIQLAVRAYQCHKTQIDSKDATKSVLGTGTKYDNTAFGLYASKVGEDKGHNDFLENIPEDRLTPVETAPLKTWTVEQILPELNEKGFFDDGEFIYADDDHGHYVYISSTLKIIIERKFDGNLPLTWYESEIWCDTEAGELIRNIEYTPEKALGKKSAVDATENALANKAVFAVNSDYYTYRVGASNHQPIGIEIRNGEVYYDSAYKAGDPQEEKFFPNKDTLAFYTDGNADVHHSSEMKADDYLKNGAYLVYSFGPYLVRDGQLSQWVTTNAQKSFYTKNPRHCFGIVEPGHYIDITCEGRLGARSEGVTMTQVAVMAQAAGCRDVLNLDGGQTEIVVFMGKQLNKINTVNGSDNVRKTVEIMAIGTSEQVGEFSFGSK